MDLNALARGLNALEQVDISIFQRRARVLQSTIWREEQGFECGDNKHVRDAVASYRTCLTDSASFAEWTLENFVGCLRKHTAQDWVNRFIDRYLSFHKIDTRLEAVWRR